MSECTRQRRLGTLAVALALLLVCIEAPRADAPELGVLLGKQAGASQRIVREGEWAANLVEILGLSFALPEDHEIADLIGLLCPELVELATEAGGRRLPSGSALRVVAEAPRRDSPSEPVKLVVTLPATALYTLSVEGVGAQRWVIDRRAVAHLDPSGLGVAQAPVIVPLRRGPHEITAYLTSAARIDRVELAAYRPLCIAPAAGWKQDRPLTFGAMARTVVRALGIEQRLPESGDPILIEGESFDTVSAWGRRTNRRLVDLPSAFAWASAAGSPAEFGYRVRLEDPGVFTLSARVHGSDPQLWSIDGHYRVTVRPGEGSDDSFARVDVLTLPLVAGEHVIRALVPRDAGIDVITLVRRKSGDADYIALMEESGLPGGAPGAFVTRATAFAALSNPTFSEHAIHFLEHLVDREDPLFLVEYDVETPYSRPLSPLLPPEL